MGKASKWFRGLFGLNKKPPHPSPSSFSNSPFNPNCNHKPSKKKWGFIKPKNHHFHRLYTSSHHQNVDFDSVSAVEVVGFTSTRRVVTTTNVVGSEAHVSVNGAHYGILEDWAVVKIQTQFRAYLARRALRALKALVKIQALVRGYIVRKRTSDSMQRVQALLRLQARARLRRSQILEYPYSPLKNTQFKNGSSRSNGKNTPSDDERNAKILEVDPGMNGVPKRRNLFHSSYHSLSTLKDSIDYQAVPSPSSEIQSFVHQKLGQNLRDACYYASDHSSPQLCPASSKGGKLSHKGHVTPTKSDGSKSYTSGYSDSPSYMSYTESSKAKIRSVSAPRQRPQYERSSSVKRYSVHGCNDATFNPLRVSGSQANFSSKAYPGSGRLDRLGMPIGGGDADVVCGGHWGRV
ncbi:hypothetical protein Leryth_023521 [Lithospermum erythrorhizon]|nr:hypothetical protein Leryth_023521 [Lithospermum erythrorhizon]